VCVNKKRETEFYGVVGHRWQTPYNLGVKGKGKGEVQIKFLKVKRYYNVTGIIVLIYCFDFNNKIVFFYYYISYCLV